jgi:uncharacterized membrane protein
MNWYTNRGRLEGFTPDRRFEWPEMDPQDWIMEILSWVGMVALIVYIFYYYRQIPDTFPRHPDAYGAPQESSPKIHLLIIPVVAILLQIIQPLRKRMYPYYGSRRLQRFIHTQKQFNSRIKLFRYSKLIVTWGLFYLAVSSIRQALGTSSGLSPWFGPVFVALIVIPLLYWRIALKDKS